MVFWIVLGGVVLGLLGIAAFLNFHPQFGGKVTPELKKEYAKSERWRGKRFYNLERTGIDISLANVPGLLLKQFQTKNRTPKQNLPIATLDPVFFDPAHTAPKFVWFGHSVLLLQIEGKNLLVDPMLGPDCAPIAPTSNKRFSKNSLDVIDTLPHIDVFFLTHDHYDHLDYASFKRLNGKVDEYFVALGTGRHLERWGVPKDKITEFSWWDQLQFGKISITFTPARHMTGRGLTDRFKSLWGGWVFKTKNHNIYWSGDGGYGKHFKEIGERLGPFDLAFMECGQYNGLWRQIHLHPEESVHAGIDVGAKTIIPVHWAGFALAFHHWKEPAERFLAEADRLGISASTPGIGAMVELGKEPTQNEWWTAYE